MRLPQPRRRPRRLRHLRLQTSNCTNSRGQPFSWLASFFLRTRLRYQKGLAEQKFGTVARPIGLSITLRSAGFSFHSQRPAASCSRFFLNASTHCCTTEASVTPVLKLPSLL